MDHMDEIANAFFNCQICFERLRNPKALSCLHTFCKDCIQTESERHNAKMTGFFPCPVCRRRTQVTDRGIEALPDNFMVSQVADILSKMKLNGDHVTCDICRTIQSDMHAKHHCIECDVNFCDECKLDHENTKIGSNHKMEPLKKPALKCNTHTEHEIKYFCREHEICVCVPCTMLEHKSCDVIEIELAAKEKVSHFESVLQSCQSIVPNIETNLKRINENIQENESVVSTLSQEISECQARLDSYERRSSRLQLLIEEDRMKKQTMEMNMQHLEDIIKVSGNLLRHNQPTDCLSVIKCLQIRLEHLTSGSGISLQVNIQPPSPAHNLLRERNTRRASISEGQNLEHKIVKPITLTMNRKMSGGKTKRPSSAKIFSSTSPPPKLTSPIKSDTELLVCHNKSKSLNNSPGCSRSSSPKINDSNMFMSFIKKAKCDSPTRQVIPSAPPMEDQLSSSYTETDKKGNSSPTELTDAGTQTMTRKYRGSPTTMSSYDPSPGSSPSPQRRRSKSSKSGENGKYSEKERHEKVKKKWHWAMEKSKNKSKNKTGYQSQGVDIIRCCLKNKTSGIPSSTEQGPILISNFGEWGTDLGKFRGPINVAVAPCGHIAVVDSLNRRVQIFDQQGTVTGTLTELSGRSIFEHILTSVTVIGTHFAIIDMVEISWGVSAYALVLFDAAGKQTTKPKILKHDKRKSLQDPRGLAFDSHSHIVVSDVDQSCISVFGSDGYFRKFFGESGSGNMKLNYPHNIQIDTNDNVYVADCWKHCIKVFSMSGQFIGTFGSEGSLDGQFHCPEGLFLYKDMLMVADSGNDRISLFTCGGQFVRHLVGNKDGIRSPRGVAVTPEGYLVVSQGLSAKEKHEIRIYDIGENFTE